MDVLVKHKVLHELKAAKNHLYITLCIFENKYDCIHVVKNSRKAQRAIGKARKIMLEGHLECCLQEKIKTLNGNQEFNEIVHLLRS